jgi:N-acetylglucosaminyldiphosphoundecaprenol N-acetyl-beta-D-mannosaminyltransferase
MRSSILGQPIDIVSIDEAVDLAKNAFQNLCQLKIITINPEMVINASKNLEFQSALNNSHLIVPDGTGIVWALKLNGNTFVKRVPGIELAERILDIANKLSKKVAIFGGRKEVLEKIVNRFKRIYPKIDIVKAVDGYQGEEKYDEVAEAISQTKPDFVLVALGTPRQEIWINRYSERFPKSIMIGIGGSLDVWSGRKRRAPKWVRNMSLEWLFRIINEPKRISRVLKSLPCFIFAVIKNKIFR